MKKPKSYRGLSRSATALHRTVGFSLCGVSTSELAYVDVRSLGKYAHDDAAYTNHLDGKSSVIRDK